MARRRRHRNLEAAAVKSGAFVSWKASRGESKGRVISIHKTRVPGIVHEMSGTAEAPAARVQLYAKSGDGWEPTTVHIGRPVTDLSTTAVLDPPSTTEDDEAVAEAIVAGSFGDIRERVEAAIRARIQELVGTSERVSVYIHDLGPSWAVYETGWNGDLFMVSYTLDVATTEVTDLGDPVAVCKVTSYVPENETGEDDGADDDGAAGMAEAAGRPDASRRVHAQMTGTAVQDVGAPTTVVESVQRIEGRLLASLGATADGGQAFAVRIIEYGDSLNGNRYPADVMRAAVPMYEGAKAFDHHRTAEELNSGTIVGLVGHYRNVNAGHDGIYGELHLLPSATHTAEALSASIANQDAGMPVLVGISHDAMTASRHVIENGRKIRECTAIRSVNSADVVAHPAAGGMATRMVAGGLPADGRPNPTTPSMKETTVYTLKQLLALLRAAESAERAGLLAEHAQVLESAGITGDEAIRMAEALPAPTTGTPPTPAAASTTERTAETRFAKGSALTNVLVGQVVGLAKLGDNMVEAILAELPDQFTEAELSAKVASAQRLLEGAERAGLAPTVTAVTKDTHDKKVVALDAMIAGDFRNGYRSLKEAFIDFTGRRPDWTGGEDFNREILRESVTLRRNGERVGFDSAARSVESVDTTTWGYALGDSITRRMVALYSQPSLQTWRQIVSSVFSVTDFRTQRIQRVGGYGTLPTVAQGAPYQPLTSPGNEEVTYALAKKGGTEDLTLETIANDDLRVIQQLPQKLGLAAAQTLYRFVWDFLDTNPNIYDATALFAAGHNNTATNALSGANLSAARKAMRKQTAYGDTSNVLSAVPKYLVVVSDLEELAHQLCTSAVAIPTGAPVGAASNTPNLHQGLTPIVVDYWTSTTKWITIADPALTPTMEVGFYQGREDPELFVQADPSVGSLFDADKVTYKIRHIYSGAWLDYRSAYRGNT